MIYSLVLALYVISVIISFAMLIVGIYARRAPKSLYFTMLTLSIFMLNIGFIFEITSDTLATAFVATQVQYFGGPFIAPFVLMFVCDFCGIQLKTRSALLLLVVPFAACILVLTWPLNGIFYRNLTFVTNGTISRIITSGSAYYYVFQIYNAILPIIADMILIYNFFHRDKLFKKQSIMIIIATILPLFSIIFILVFDVVGLNFDPTPVFLGITCLLLGYSFLRLGLYRVAPIARAQIVETLHDGFIIIDTRGNFIDANLSAKHILPQLASISAGSKIKEVDEIAWISESDDKRDNEFSVQGEDGAMKHYKLSETQITNAKKTVGRCIMIFDITHTKQLLDEISILAEHDALTGLLNRRTFFSNGELLFGNLARSGVQSGMMMIDIDFFKNVNDSYGHPKGDEVLVAIAEILSSRLRNTDLIARYGGEEFCVFLPNIATQNAIELAEQLRRLVEEIEFSANDSKFHITVSIGLAICGPACYVSFSSLLSDADAALYKAKNAGRNNVHVAGSESSVTK